MKRRTLALGIFSLLLLSGFTTEVSYPQQKNTDASSYSVGSTVSLSDPYLNCDKTDPYSLTVILAKELKLNPMDLFVIMFFESGGKFDPQAENPKSSSKGVLQINNSSVKFLLNKKGKRMKSSKEMLREYPTLFEQMKIPTHDDRIGGPVYQYFKRLQPYKNTSDLFMAVLYPSARGKKHFKLPGAVTRGNFGVRTADDYVNLVYRKAESFGIKRIDMD